MVQKSRTPAPIPLSEIREGVLNVRAVDEEQKVVIVRRGDEVRVFGEVCPHMGADLTEGRYCAKDGTLHCPWHGYVFSTEDGRFLSNPNEQIMALARAPSKHFRPEKTPRYRLSSIPFSVVDGCLVLGREAGDGRPLELAGKAPSPPCAELARGTDGGAP